MEVFMVYRDGLTEAIVVSRVGADLSRPFA